MDRPNHVTRCLRGELVAEIIDTGSRELQYLLIHLCSDFWDEPKKVVQEPTNDSLKFLNLFEFSKVRKIKYDFLNSSAVHFISKGLYHKTLCISFFTEKEKN